MRGFIAIGCVSLLSIFASEVSGQENTYTAGDTVTIFAGTSPGGTNDAVMRMVADHIGKHLPGNPSVVPQNMPGAGSRKLAAYLQSRAPKDGTEIALLLRPIVTDALLSGTGDGAQFDVQDFNWLGSPSPVTDICFFWEKSPVQSFEELQSTEMVIPGIGADAGEITQATILGKLTGAKIRTVLGFESGSEMNLALERGEADGRCAVGWEAMKGSYADWVAENRFKPFIQFAMERNPELPGTPSIMEFAKSDLDTQALEVFLAPQQFGFPLAAPPGVSPETVEMLRTALNETFSDPEFIAAAEALRFSVNPVDGAKLTEIIERIHSYPPEVLERIQELRSAN